MALDNTYVIHEENIVKLLNNIDEFTSKIIKFQDRYSQYDYDLKITKNNEDSPFKWTALINIRSKNGTVSTTTS